jgi:hypothetical protein
VIACLPPSAAGPQTPVDVQRPWSGGLRNRSGRRQAPPNRARRWSRGRRDLRGRGQRCRDSIGRASGCGRRIRPIVRHELMAQADSRSSAPALITSPAVVKAASSRSARSRSSLEAAASRASASSSRHWASSARTSGGGPAAGRWGRGCERPSRRGRTRRSPGPGEQDQPVDGLRGGRLGEPRCHPRADRRDEPDVDLRLPDPGGVPGEADVAVQHHLETTADRGAWTAARSGFGDARIPRTRS